MVANRSPNKLERLVAAYARFAADIADVPDEWAARLRCTAESVAEVVAKLSKPSSAVSRAQIAAGLEQGLRETPDLIACVTPQWRTQVSGAFSASVRKEFPELYANDRKSLERVLARRRINSEAEYYLVRYHVDAAASDPRAAELASHLTGLLEKYELQA